MATGAIARDFTFDWGGTTIVGVKTRAMNINKEFIDITTDDDDGYRTLLSEPGVRSIEITLGLITDDEVLLADLLNDAGQTIETALPSSLATPGDINGQFQITSMELTGETDGAYEISVTFQSTGSFNYTASST